MEYGLDDLRRVSIHAEEYYSTVMSLYPHMVCNVPVSCKANGDRNQLGAWLGSHLIVEL